MSKTIRLARCIACKGDYLTVTQTASPGEYRQSICRHCTAGYMTAYQVASYTEWQASRAVRTTEAELLATLSSIPVAPMLGAAGGSEDDSAHAPTTYVDVEDWAGEVDLPSLSELPDSVADFQPYF